MRVLVIGASGFIGPPLVRQLQDQGHIVAAFHRGNHATPFDAVAIRGDRNQLPASRAAIADFAPDVVVDLILSSERQTRGLVEALRGLTTRIVAASSMDVYRASSVLHRLDNGPLQDLPLTEDSERRSRPPYPPEMLRRMQPIMNWIDDGYDKVAVERALRTAPEFGATILRLPMIFGPGDPLHRLHPILRRIDDRRPAILLSEDMAQWCGPRGYVDNVAAAIALAATDDRAAGRTYNVATFSISELQWTRTIADQTGWRGEIVVLPRERMPAHLVDGNNYAQHWTASSQRIREELGYAEPVCLAESLRRTIEWERANRPAVALSAFDYSAEDAALSGGTHAAS